MRTWREALLGLAILAAASPAACAEERAYAIDGERSTLTVRVFKAGFLSSLGHDHTIEARGVAGTIAADPARPAGGRVAFEVASSRLAVADPGIDEDDREEIQENMDAEVLEVAKYPTIAFRSTRVEAVPETPGALLVEGDLALHGVTRRISLVVLFEAVGAGRDEILARGSTTLLQTDYGIEPFSTALGAVGVKNEVKIEFAIRARAAGTAGSKGSDDGKRGS